MSEVIVPDSEEVIVPDSESEYATISPTDDDIECVCVSVSGEGKKKFWALTCPCGVIDVYPLNKLPEVDTLHSCGNPKHWTVKFQEITP